MRTWPSALAGFVGIIVLVGLAWQSGGYFPPAYLGAGAVVYATLALIVAVQPPHYAFSTEALIALVALTALAVWTGISTGWSPSPDTGLETMQRNFVYVGLFGLGLLAAGSGRLARAFVWGLCAVIVVVVGAGLLSRLYPHLLPSNGVGLSDRLAYPLTYTNAYGALAAMGVILTVGLAADARHGALVRAWGAAFSVLITTALYLTLSRGAFLALFLGALVLIALFPRRGSLISTVLIVSFAATVAIVRLGHHHALIEVPKSGDGQASAGSSYGPQLLLLMVLAGLAQAGIAAAQGSSRIATIGGRYKRPVLISLGGVFAVGALAFYVLNQSSVEGRAREWTSATSDFAERQWHGFFNPTATFATAHITDRLTTAQGQRLEFWRVAANTFTHHPIVGDGAGSYEFHWFRERRVEGRVRNAHSLYLETLAELGLVGFVLLAAFIASLVVAAVRVRRRYGVLDAPLAAGVIATCAVWLVHAGVDWDWQVSALSGLGILLAATLYPRGRTISRRKGEGAS